MPANFDNKIFLLPVIGATCLLIAFFLFAKLAPGIPLSVTQITTNKTGLFTVTGEGKAQAQPDIAQISLGITVNGPTVGGVQSQANQTINSVSSAIKKLRVGDKDIKTSSYNLRPEYDYASPGSLRIKGYTADINLLVKARQFDKINQIIDAATGNGANQVGGLSFTLDDVTEEKLTTQARKQAIDKAKQKAAEIAQESGINLGQIVDVQENSNNYIRPMPLMGAKTAEDAGVSTPTQIEPGASEITISVTLSYETR